MTNSHDHVPGGVSVISLEGFGLKKVLPGRYFAAIEAK